RPETLIITAPNRTVWEDMEALEAIKSVKSVSKYKPDPVPEQKVQAVMNAARVANAAENVQPWTFIVVSDADPQRQVAGDWRDARVLPERRGVCPGRGRYAPGDCGGVRAPVGQETHFGDPLVQYVRMSDPKSQRVLEQACMAQRALTPGNAAYCSECGAETQPDAQACARCEQPFTGSMQAVFCPICNSINPAEAAECVNCNANFPEP